MQNPESQTVTDHIAALPDPHRETIAFLRTVILSTDTTIAEHIKWNSPSFYYNGEMKTFNAKEYKRDLAVINLHRNKILIVFPTGNKIDPKIGLLGKDYPDGRKIIEIQTLQDAQNKADLLQQGIKNWLLQIDQ